MNIELMLSRMVVVGVKRLCSDFSKLMVIFFLWATTYGAQASILGTWQSREFNNDFQMVVSWNGALGQYEGTLSLHSMGTRYVGFQLGEIVWFATPTDDPYILNDSWKWRAGANGVTYNHFWQAGVMDLRHSTDNVLVTSDGTLDRIGNSDQTMNPHAPQPIFPVALANIQPAVGAAPLTISFNGSGSVDSDGFIAEYLWTSSDGQILQGISGTMTFDNPGTYTVSLAVTDNSGFTSYASYNITATESSEEPVSDGVEYIESAGNADYINNDKCAEAEENMDIIIHCVNVNNAQYKVSLTHYDSGGNSPSINWFLGNVYEVSEMKSCATLDDRGDLIVPCLQFDSKEYNITLHRIVDPIFPFNLTWKLGNASVIAK